jgi:hypothetical protein
MPLVAVLVLLLGTTAQAADVGTVVVRVAVDPPPAGIDWSFSGLGARFALGSSSSERRVDVAPGTYTIVEGTTRPGQPNTLTRVFCTGGAGDTTTNVAARSATVAVAASTTVTCTFTQRALGLRPGAASLALARLYAPVVRLSSSEPYRPLRIEEYLGSTVERAGAPPRGTVQDARPTAFTLPLRAARTYLDVRGAEPFYGASAYPRIEAKLEAAAPRPTLYWHLVRQPSSGRVAIEYWLLYLYNAFFDRHEADWEGISVFLEAGAPEGVSYSEHQGRRWVGWAAQSKLATHPLVYVARGSHANYDRPGRYGVRVCWKLRVRTCAPTTKHDVADGKGRALDPQLYDLHELGGTAYTGGWGSGNYVFGVGLTHDRVTDPRTRTDYTDPFRAVPR